MEQHNLKSSFREKLVEHLFVGELLKLSWLDQHCSLEIAKPEVDSQGYDLIVEMNDVIRHIQLKTSHLKATTNSQKIHIALSSKQSGCVVWIMFNDEDLSLGPFLFFGGDAGSPLPNLDSFKVAKHAKGNAQGVKAERPALRVVPKSRFTKYNTVKDVYKRLFIKPA